RQRRRMRQASLRQRSEPDLERHEPPEQMTVVAPMGSMLSYHSCDRLAVDIRSHPRVPVEQRVESMPDLFAEPSPQRHAEAVLWMREHTRGHEIADRLAQYPLADTVPLFEAARQRH